MHSESLAEWILSLFADDDRANSTVGDFLEELPARGRIWFWFSIGKTTCAWLGRGLMEVPVRMAGFAVFAWFVYMLMGVLLGFAGWIAATLLWGLGYFLTHHTGLELLTDLLRLRFSWPAPPYEWVQVVDCLIVWIAAPYQLGRLSARPWYNREIATWLYLALIWPILIVFVPFTGLYARASLTAAPVILTSVLAGMLRESWRQRRSVAIRRG